MTNTEVISLESSPRFIWISGAAATIFVHGSRSNNLLCTLPFSLRPPPSTFSSVIGRKLHEKISTIHPSEISNEILVSIDEALEDYINNLSQSKALNLIFISFIYFEPFLSNKYISMVNDRLITMSFFYMLIR